jgi:predicted nucleic acid-binding Zn ribbon protein
MSGRRWAWRDDEPEVKRPPRRLQDGLSELAAELRLDAPEVLDAVLGRWAEVVGPMVAAHARTKVLRDGVLHVEVDSPEWATQLRYLESEILRKFSRRLQPGVVTSLQVSVRRPG